MNPVSYILLVTLDTIQKNLQKTYLQLTLPALSLFIVLYLTKNYVTVQINIQSRMDIIAPLFFVAGVSFALAFPVLFRSIFIHKIKNQRNISASQFLNFQRNFLRIALVTPYLALIAAFLDLPDFYFAGTFICALYTIYYYYPSDKRIKLEKKIFRISE